MAPPIEIRFRISPAQYGLRQRWSPPLLRACFGLSNATTRAARRGAEASRARREAIAPVNVFLSHAPEDREHRELLEKHLTPLMREGILELLHGEKAPLGEPASRTVQAYLDAAAITLLFFSSDYVASEQCHREMRYAMDRARKGRTQVVPLLLRPCLEPRGLIADLRPLPSDGRPITSWTSADEAWTDVARGIAALVELHGTSEPEADAL